MLIGGLSLKGAWLVNISRDLTCGYTVFSFKVRCDGDDTCWVCSGDKKILRFGTLFDVKIPPSSKGLTARDEGLSFMPLRS